MQIPRSRIILLTVFLASVVFFLIRMDLVPGISTRLAQRSGFELLSTLLRYIQNDYLEERDPLRTADGAYRGLVNSLDALSGYLDKDLTSRYRSRLEMTGETGLIIFKSYGDFPQVLWIVGGSPAEKAGLKPGDILSAIDGRNTLQMSLAEANLRLQGAEGESVVLKVLRRDDTLELTVGKARLHPRPFAVTQGEGSYTTLVVHRFFPSLSGAIIKAIPPEVIDQKRPIVIDLRDCSQGDFEEASAFVNLFLKSPVIGRFEKRGGIKTTVSASATPSAPGIPLIVWTGPGTMGAAEFVAAVLQEVGKAKVVGTPTLGLVAKGQAHPLKDGSSILLTSEVFSLPSGKSLWGRGVRPDENLAGGDLADSTYLEKTRLLLVKH